MPNKMLIDATHPEETRVVVVRGNRVEEFDFETAQRKQLRGNIYLAKVTRVEPSLQAAFIEYGGNRHGFLAFSEIHPDYYQIPVADRQALIEADERAHREAEEETETRSNSRGRRPRHRNSRRRGNGERVQSEVIDNAGADASVDLNTIPLAVIDRVEVLNRSFTEYLKSRPDRSLDRYVLLDAQDWMTDAQLTALWAEITRTARPGARVIFRTAAEPSLLPGRVDPALLARWRYEEALSRALTGRDRSAIYGGFHLYVFEG